MVERIRFEFAKVGDSAAKPKRARSKRSSNGRDEIGRFAKGNTCFKGSVFGLMGKLRRAVVECVSEDDISLIMVKLVRLARNGDLAAARLVLDYSVGKPESLDLIGRLDELERLCEEKLP